MSNNAVSFKPEFKTIREEIRYCAQNNVPFFDDGEMFSADVVYSHERHAIRIITGDMATLDSNANFMWIPVGFGIIDTVRNLYRANTGKDISGLHSSLPEPWMSNDKETMKKYYLITITGELYTK